MEQKKILHIIKGLGRGGAERLLVSTIRQHGKAYHFDVVYFLPNKNHLVEDLEALGCTVTCLNAPNVLKMIATIPALIRLIKASHYQVLHAHLPWSGILARVAGKVTGVPVVYTEHNLFDRYNVITRLFSRLTYRWQAQVIAVSERVAAVLKEHVGSEVPVRIISNGVDVGEFERHTLGGNRKVESPALQAVSQKRQEGKIIMGTVTALTPQKRIDRWLRIASKVLEQRQDVFFVIVGDGVLREELEERAKALTSAGQLIFAGQSADPGEWLALTDIFLMTSDFEGLPVALLEAMSMECVPVVTSVGGIPAVVQHGRNGFLYEPQAEDEAVEHILALVQDPGRRKATGNQARNTVVAGYGIERMVGELEEVYRGAER